MTVHTALGAIAALLVTFPVDASTGPAIDIGTFVNTGVGAIGYKGNFGDYVSSAKVAGPSQHTLISVDLGGLLTSLGVDAFLGVRITDTGLNTYGTLSPGADVDLFGFDGLSPDIDLLYIYGGPNPVHQNETTEQLALRVGAIDTFSGAQDAWHQTHVSLGQEGSLTVLLSDPQDVIDFPGPGVAGVGPFLLMSEAGTSESFQVDVLAIPAPGTLVLLGLAAVFARSRRRRVRPEAATERSKQL